MSEDTVHDAVPLPDYLEKVYWWAYVRPWAVRVFEREWLVNLILWGWYRPLRDRLLALMGEKIPGRTLKISCCYGALEPMLAARVASGGGQLDIIDVAPEQIKNARRKIPKGLEKTTVRLFLRDATNLGFSDHAYDRAVLFFLPHEQPDDVRRQTFAQAFRVVKPGGTLYVVEFGRCVWGHPLHYIWHPVLRVLEPFAAPVWSQEMTTWLPENGRGCNIEKLSLFGGFYQILTITTPREASIKNKQNA